jgi:hypothetical protein
MLTCHVSAIRNLNNNFDMYKIAQYVEEPNIQDLKVAGPDETV